MILVSITGISFGCVMPTAQLVAQTVVGRGRLSAALGTTVFGVPIFTLLPGVPHGATPADFLKLPVAQVRHAFHVAFGLMAVTDALGSWIASRAPAVQLR